MLFPDLNAMADAFERKSNQYPTAEAIVLDLIGTDVEKAAKDRIGEYQAAAGPFAAWEPLAYSTLYGWGGHPGKIDLGFAPPDNPELRTGGLRDSIHHKVLGHTVYIGSDESIMEWQEFGTAKMPARSILGAAMYQQAPYQAEHAMSLLVRFLFDG